MLIKTAIRRVLARCKRERLPAQARMERDRDRSQGLGEDHGIERSVAAAIDWLCLAQDESTTRDGGVARHYSLTDGWGPSYPETTGYIVPTLIHMANARGDQRLAERARRMLDWLVSIQFPEGGFQGGTIGSRPVVPVTFNTGQILLGLAAGAAEYGEPYSSAMHKAAEWLVSTQDADGCWRRYPTPFAEPGEKAYETHVAWGLLEAAKVGREARYTDAAMRNIRWALGKQQPNGWFSDCCLGDPGQPFTHTIGYALRGVLEGYEATGEASLLRAAVCCGKGALTAIGKNGFLPGRLDQNWRGTVRWACLTGSVQIAHCWLLLYRATNDTRFRDAGISANAYVRRTIQIDGPAERRGGIKGSFPVSGDYGQYQYLNWAAKFFIDANMLEGSIRNSIA